MASTKTNKVKKLTSLLMLHFLRYETLLLVQKDSIALKLLKCTLSLLSMAHLLYNTLNIWFFITKNDELSVITIRYIHKGKKIDVFSIFCVGTFFISPYSEYHVMITNKRFCFVSKKFSSWISKYGLQTKFFDHESL